MGNQNNRAENGKSETKAKSEAKDRSGSKDKSSGLVKSVAKMGPGKTEAARNINAENGNGELVTAEGELKASELRFAEAKAKLNDAQAHLNDAEAKYVHVKSKKKKKKTISKSDAQLSHDDLLLINSNRGLIELLRSKNIRIKDVMSTLKYEKELVYLQIELVKLQRWANDNGKRIAILFEGRDAAGKGGAIRRFTEHLNPRSLRVVALPKPSLEEQGQWYFQRYSRYLPNEGEIVFFDRSWYNRAVVEPVNGFCTQNEYQRFLQQVPEWEHMLYEDGVTIIKFWFSISKAEQSKRFGLRRKNPLKQWKLSPIDERAQELWNDYTHYKEEMFSKTHTSFSPWIIVQANNKKLARLESIRYVLDLLPYAGKENAKLRIMPDPNIITRYHRNQTGLD